MVEVVVAARAAGLARTPTPTVRRTAVDAVKSRWTTECRLNAQACDGA